MFLIFGIRNTERRLGQLAYECPICQGHSHWSAFVLKRWLTLFFAPVILLRERYGIQCNNCGKWLHAVDGLERQLRSWACTGVLVPEVALLAQSTRLEADLRAKQ